MATTSGSNNGRSAAGLNHGQDERTPGAQAGAFATPFWQRLSASLGGRLLVLALLMAAVFGGIYAAGEFNPQNYWLTILAKNHPGSRLQQPGDYSCQ